LKNQFINIR